MNTTNRRRRRAGALLALALLATGCTGGFGDVSGKVTYKGQPLAGATITFYDVANNAVSNTIDAEGNYTVHNVAVGTARVVLLMPLPIVFKGMEGLGGAKPAATALTPSNKLPRLPAKYSTPDQSGLTLEVKRGSQTKDFPLTD